MALRPKQALRLAVDAGMLLLLVLLMGYSLTGGEVHEWMGAALGFLIALHLWLNAGWFGTLLQGRYRWRRAVATGINLLLLLALVVLVLSALPISGTLFPFVHLFAEEQWPAQLHIAASNWFLVLSALHLGLQWGRVRVHLPRPLAQPGLVLRLLLYAAALYGLWAMGTRQLHEKLVMYSSFDFARFEATWPGLLLDYGAIFTTLSLLSYRLLAQRPKR